MSFEQVAGCLLALGVAAMVAARILWSRIVDRLRTDHAEFWTRIGSPGSIAPPGFFGGVSKMLRAAHDQVNAEASFAFLRDHEALGDAQLDRLVNRFRSAERWRMMLLASGFALLLASAVLKD